MSIDRRLLRRNARRAAIGGGVLLIAVWLLALRPQALGGPAAYITVAGVSMEPTLRAGDLVIMTRATVYEPGDVVAYRVPDGDPAAGRHVIHRVIGGGPEEGYLLQGDNTPAPDRWRPSDDDIVGRQLVVIPGMGSALMLLKTPAALGGLAAALVVFALPWWTAPSGPSASGPRRAPAAVDAMRLARTAKIKLVALHQGILVDEVPGLETCRAQVLVEFRNEGTDWAEVDPAMSTYATTGADGAIARYGAFASVHPRRVAPGEKGYMLANVADAGLTADQLVTVSSVIACRDARPGAASRPLIAFATRPG